MGLYSTRNVPLYAIISAPILAQLTRDFFQTDRVFTPVLRFENRLRKTDRKINGGALPIVFVLLVALAFNDNYHFLDFGGSGNQFDPEIFPVDAVNWIVSNPQSGNIFNYFPWGGYLLYRLWPQELVFIDGQTDFYGENLTREYEQIITNQPGTPDLLSKYQVSWALLPRDTLIAKSLKNDLDWTMVYEDKVAVILVR